MNVPAASNGVSLRDRSHATQLDIAQQSPSDFVLHRRCKQWGIRPKEIETGGGNYIEKVSGDYIQGYYFENRDRSVVLSNTTSILFLASNPKETGRLRLDEELRDIDESLRRAQRRNQFKLENKGAVRTRDFSRALLDTNPQIVHFSGHGISSNTSPSEGLVFEDVTGHVQLIPSEQLADVFELFADQVECVLLNSCHSQNQAEAIAQHIPYVIGMSRPISDKGAIEFAIAFYDAIGAGRDIPFAFKLARIQLIPFGEKDIPQLLQKPSIST